MADINEQTPPNCLVIVSSYEKGIDYGSFRRVINTLEGAFTVFIGSPLGGVVQFSQNPESKPDEKEIEPKSMPFDLVDPHKFIALFIPSMYCSLIDLSSNERLGYIINEMHKMHKTICCMGYGVSALLSARKINDGAVPISSNEWLFDDYTLTGPTLYEELTEKTPDFPLSNFFLESKLRSYGANFTCARIATTTHMVVDGNLITAQNDSSTPFALNMAIYMTKK
ncbi:hypothetical protein MXB_88 [Myxobolus squamalis]|nr:hypothetical protein MXB_88 [Myxobolus squamalis]